MPKYPLRSSPPWHFRLAKWLIRNKLRGGYRLIELAERRGWLNCVVEYELSSDVKLSVPLWRRENQWALPDLRAYEKQLVSRLALFSVSAGLTMTIPFLPIGSMSVLTLER